MNNNAALKNKVIAKTITKIGVLTMVNYIYQLSIGTN